jgi:uncharacterized cupin superfamily protein
MAADSAKPRLKLPALHPDQVPKQRGTLYPEPFKRRVINRTKQRLGDACGLTQFGVNLVTLEPGAQSALRHWHTGEDEFVYLLSGEVVLISNDGEQTLRAGDCAGYPAGKDDAHHFVNRSDQPARYLEIGTRVDNDKAHYPDDDLTWLQEQVKQADGSSKTIDVPAHKDGRKY